MAHDQPLLVVQEALKKCFPVVEEQQDLWQSTLQDCLPLLSSLSNLAEQLQAAQSLRFEDVLALRPFPDLQERLRRKQLEAGDIVLDKLTERLATLLRVRNTISSHVEQVFQTYEQHADVLDIDTLLRPSVVSPSVTDMLEWLQDIDRHFRSSYPFSASRPPRAALQVQTSRVSRLHDLLQFSLTLNLRFFLHFF
ncbi:AFG2-interacting ribosome maturation factor isoform X2 [Rattus norvegicus]